VVGFGCDAVSGQAMAELETQWTRLAGFPVRVVCPHMQEDEATTRTGFRSRVSATTKTVRSVASIICNIKLARDSTVVRMLRATVDREIFTNGNHVVVIGHSYGGSVASRLLDTVHGDPAYDGKLQIYTVGAIQLPDAVLHAPTHFVNRGDTSARSCLHGVRRDDLLRIGATGDGHTDYNAAMVGLFRNGRVPSVGGRRRPRAAPAQPRAANSRRSA
jgi:hypothetical protein